MERKNLRDVLPKLCQIMVKDFSDFRDELEDVLEAYAEVFSLLSNFLYRKSEEAEAEAVEIIERYIRKRDVGIRGNRLVPAYKCLLCELDEIPYKLFDRMTEELEKDICELMEEWDREDFNSDGGEYDETGHL